MAAGVPQREGVQASAHFPGPTEAEDHRGGGHDLSRDRHGGSLLHEEEGHKVG